MVAISFSRGSSQPKDQTHFSYVSYIGATWEAQGKCINIINTAIPAFISLGTLVHRIPSLSWVLVWRRKSLIYYVYLFYSSASSLRGPHWIPFIPAFPGASPHISRSPWILSTVGSRYWTQLILDDLKTGEWSPGMWSNQMTDRLSILSLFLSLLSSCLPNSSLKHLLLEREPGGMNKNQDGFPRVHSPVSPVPSLSGF